ncbi:MAG: DUF4091 domain-containing protein [Clostridia bacterium]|nr:DUF4091 domain-containing protein [Clostridia bacterium]
MIRSVQISSLENILPKVRQEFTPISEITVLKGEKTSYQIAYICDAVCDGKIKIESDIKENIHAYTIGCVPVKRTVFVPKALTDDNYLSVEPGMYPDILQEIKDEVIPLRYYYQGIWMELDGNVKPGKYEIKVTLIGCDDSVTHSMRLEVLDLELPKQKLTYGIAVHGDCIADHYGVKVFSEKYWELLEKFIRISVEYGSDMLVLPVFTPPVDTFVGGERTTVQLVKVEKNGDDYTFDYSLFDRYVKMCLNAGIEKFYVSPLFTQWGAEFTPKIIATVDNEERRIFGWDVRSTDEAYLSFLRQFVPSLIKRLKELNIEKNVFFSISDEPFDDETVKRYAKLSSVLSPMLKGFKVVDAFTHFDRFERSGADIPLIPTSDIDNFELEKIDTLSVYFCCAQDHKVANRFITMPLYRNRSFGYQLFRYDVKMFFHWALNFYNAPLSVKRIDPFTVPDADGGYPAGDCFSVYPGENGPVRSMRIVVFNEALQDMRALELLASYIGRERVIGLIEEITGAITFENCAHNAKTILDIRKKITDELKNVKREK